MLSSFMRKRGKNGLLLLLYTLIVFIFASAMFFFQSIKKEASLILQDSPEWVVQRVTAGRHDVMPVNHIKKVQGITGVSSVRGRLWGYYYDPITGANYTLWVPEDFPCEEGDIIIGEGVSRSRLVYEEDTMEFRDYKGAISIFKVKQILSPRTSRVSSDLVLICESDFRKFYGIHEGYVTDLVFSLRKTETPHSIANRIAKLLPDTKLVGREEVFTTYRTGLSWKKGILRVILFSTILAFIILAWDKASGLNEEDRKEIGILKATGWQTSDVVMLKLWEGTGISLSSFLIGIVLAYVHVFFMSSALFEPVLKGWAVLYPDFKLIPYVDPYQVLGLLLLTVFPYTIATILPSLKAVAIDPDSIMRA